VTEWNKALPADQLWQVSPWADSAFFLEKCDEDLGIEEVYLFGGIQVFNKWSWTNKGALSSRERYLARSVYDQYAGTETNLRCAGSTHPFSFARHADAGAERKGKGGQETAAVMCS
jgi:hypothetical protein